ncbi:class I SAM-dependent methyltransferase [Echria macrotheca]|uniref:Class I SAM-dependent methyltransferase n=1 Tax=Echria macrotheca TaxID=438768 RepID=A0AAJ0B1C1_9PEZI|nr:class I SAM-dependent methyltransferase [Echria macrotheca]
MASETNSDVRIWNKESEKYSEKPIADPEAYARTIARAREFLKPDASVVELGCGTGGTAAQLVGSVKSYLATDFADGMIAIAQRRHPIDLNSSSSSSDQKKKLTFRVATAESLVAENKKFDAVLAFNFFHLVRDLPATLRLVHGLLAPGGLLISKTPCMREMKMGLLMKVMIPAAVAVGLAPSVRVFTAEEFRKQVLAAGFEIVVSEYHAAGEGDFRPFIVARKVGQ